MKSSSKMLQNLPHILYIYENPKLLFPFRATLIFSLMNAPGLCRLLYTYKKWQILKHFAGSFHQEKTSFF